MNTIRWNCPLVSLLQSINNSAESITKAPCVIVQGSQKCSWSKVCFPFNYIQLIHKTACCAEAKNVVLQILWTSSSIYINSRNKRMARPLILHWSHSFMLFDILLLVSGPSPARILLLAQTSAHTNGLAALGVQWIQDCFDTFWDTAWSWFDT